MIRTPGLTSFIESTFAVKIDSFNDANAIPSNSENPMIRHLTILSRYFAKFSVRLSDTRDICVYATSVIFFLSSSTISTSESSPESSSESFLMLELPA